MSTARILSEDVSLSGTAKNIEEAACGEEDNPSRLICFTYFGKIIVERHVRRESNELEDCPNGKTAISSEIHIQNYLLQNNIHITLDFVAIEDLALTHNYAFFLALKPSVRVYRFRFDHIYGYNSQLYCLTFDDSQEKPLKVDEVTGDVAIESNCTKGQRHFHIVDAVISVERMKPSSTAHRTHLEKTSSNSSNSIHTPSGLSAPPVHETTSELATVSDDSDNKPSRIPVLSACSPSPSSLEPSGDLPSERIASVPNHSPQKTPAYPKEIAAELSHCHENQLLVIDELKIKKFNQSAIPRALLCCTDACCYLALNSRADAPSLWCIFDETQHWNESNSSSETVHVLQIGTSQAIAQMKAGKAHVLLLNAEGEVFSFGNGTRGELGHGSLGSEQMPKQVDALVVLRVVQIDCGAWHSVALTQDGDVYVWGWNNCGQLTVAGDCLETDEKSTTKIISVPEPLDLEPAIASISAYRNATLLKRADNHEIIVLGRMDYDIESCH